jgi:hypothetical protein
MKTLPVVGAIAVALVSFGLTAPAQDAALHAPDGGTQQRVESVVIPPQTNAPFSAVITTEWTRIMPDGSKATIRNHRTVARDSSGRVFQERRYFTPDGDKQITRLLELDYEDPARHETWVCHPNMQVCSVYKSGMSTMVTTQKSGPLPNGRGEVTLEQLGQKTIEGVDVVGSREVTTLNAGAMGNEKPQPIVKEFWYSPRLGINIATKRFDPRASAIQDFEVSLINLGEPDAKLFEPPAGFRVVRMDGQ